MDTRHPSEETLYAFVDEQLDAEAAGEVARHVEACAQCGAAVAEARGFAAAATRIVSALDGVPGHVIPARRARRFPPWLAAAAVVLLAVGVSSVAIRSGFEPDVTVSESRGVEAMAADAVAERADPATAVKESAESVASGTRSAASGRESRRLAGNTPSARDVAVASTARESAPVPAPADVGTVAGLPQQRPSAAAAPPPPPPPSADFAAPEAGKRAVATQQQRTDSLQLDQLRTEPQRRSLNEVVVTGAEPRVRAAEAAAAPQSVTALRVVRYLVRPGVVVELREFREAITRVETAAGEHAYIWSNESRTRYFVLSGPLSQEELAALARRLDELQVIR